MRTGEPAARAQGGRQERFLRAVTFAISPGFALSRKWAPRGLVFFAWSPTPSFSPLERSSPLARRGCALREVGLANDSSHGSEDLVKRWKDCHLVGQPCEPKRFQPCFFSSDRDLQACARPA